MEWDKIKQKWAEMTVRVQPLRPPGERNVRIVKDSGQTIGAGSDQTADTMTRLPTRAADKRSAV